MTHDRTLIRQPVPLDEDASVGPPLTVAGGVLAQRLDEAVAWAERVSAALLHAELDELHGDAEWLVLRLRSLRRDLIAVSNATAERSLQWWCAT